MRLLVSSSILIVAWSLAGPALAAKPQMAAWRDCPDCPEMVTIPAGEFLMGTPRALQVPTEVPAELQPLRIEIKRRFALGRFEVTRAEFQAFASATNFSKPIKCRTWVESLQAFRDIATTWDKPNLPARSTPRDPASCVNWHDAQAYVAWLSQKTGLHYRLPSETEWE